MTAVWENFGIFSGTGTGTGYPFVIASQSTNLFHTSAGLVLTLSSIPISFRFGAHSYVSAYIFIIITLTSVGKLKINYLQHRWINSFQLGHPFIMSLVISYFLISFI